MRTVGFQARESLNNTQTFTFWRCPLPIQPQSVTSLPALRWGEVDGEPIPSLHVAWPLQGCWICCDTEKTVPSTGDSHTAPQLSQPELSSSNVARGVGWLCLPHLLSPASPQHLAAWKAGSSTSPGSLGSHQGAGWEDELPSVWG